jgi:sterol desaturase/sphingolipid hydroxylase (fatty acid hydroxylase superfamily)
MIGAAINLLVLMVLFSVVEGCWPASAAHKWWRRPLLVDLCSWSIHPLAIGAGVTVAVASTRALLSAVPNEGFWAALLSLRARVAGFPLIPQTIAALMITDFLSYWIHRAYHRLPLLWAFHVVHHTSEKLDWLSTSRLHPLSQTLNTALLGTILLMAGLPLKAVVVANAMIGAAALLVHANVRWTFGPLRYLLVSPIFHQWHHARPDDAASHDEPANFGAMFSIWDRLFGTWSLPSVRPPRFGVAGAPAPTILGLLLHPARLCIRFVSRRQRR